MQSVTEAEVNGPAVLGGRYVLGERLGGGGAADVYRGRDQVLLRDVAVKVVRGEAFDEQRHAGEMRTLAGLCHPGLVALYDAGSDRERGYFVMELVEGGTLAESCRSGPLDPGWVATMGVTLADALGYVHRRGIVHRDIKPGNVLVTWGSRVKLADFGIARVVDSAHLTATGLTMGTAAYLAPEQVTGGPVGTPADVYSLGLVLLECLTGRREYDGRGIETALARLERPPRVPAVLSADWRRLLAGMLAENPADRVSASSAAARLQQLAGGPPGGSPAGSDGDLATDTVELPVPAPRPERRGRWRPAAGAVLVVGLVASGVSAGRGLPWHRAVPTAGLSARVPAGPSPSGGSDDSSSAGSGVVGSGVAGSGVAGPGVAGPGVAGPGVAGPAPTGSVAAAALPADSSSAIGSGEPSSAAPPSSPATSRASSRQAAASSAVSTPSASTVDSPAQDDDGKSAKSGRKAEAKGKHDR